ncbi:phosphotransferase family protein [Herpetosiphon llansteffanensis]|uniref:phosphotransferase family protein n=1 Tax=Herpetosiphon llansteffanensis TaxID=2094568 RepID=UPI000D7C6812|nr:aminoglycoside phosphotransferase family protein [Herpetosiphon llansteffanensis]
MQLDPRLQQAIEADSGFQLEYISFIGAGWFAQAYQFEHQNQTYVVRISKHYQDFLKDAYAAQHWGQHLPIPPILAHQQFADGWVYAISPYIAGQTISALEPQQLSQIQPHLFQTMHQLHQQDLGSSTGWGLANAQGQGRYQTGAEEILDIGNYKFDYNWREWYERQDQTGSLLRQGYRVMERLLSTITTERYLMHRDFGFDNVICQPQAIVAVLDWAEFGYGDWVYDLAQQSCNAQTKNYLHAWLPFAQQYDIIPDNLENRLHCYWLHMNLTDLIMSQLRNDWAWHRDIVPELTWLIENPVRVRLNS